VLLIVGGLAVGVVADPGGQVSVEDVDGSNYVGVVHRELGAASESVVVSMFQIRVPEDPFPNSPALLLVNALIAAHRRGVDVRVVLDLHSTYDPESVVPVRDHLNGLAADMLSYAGIGVSYYPARYHLHHKLVVIDKETVVIGSHNWSFAGFRHNIENSSLIRSREHARAKLDSIAAIETIPAASVSVVGVTVPVPRAFLVRPELAPIMVSENDGRPFDTYLLLRRYAFEAKSLSFPVAPLTLATELQIAPDKNTKYQRKLALRPLRTLAERYGLIDLDLKRGGDANITLRDDGMGGEEDLIHVPLGYWAYGLATELKQAEKFMYLVCLNEANQGLTPPYWRKSQEKLTETYSVSRNPINSGLTGLQRRDLLTISRSPIPAGDYSKRRPNQYCLKPLLSSEMRTARWEKLKEKHSPELVTQARGLASAVGYGNDFVSADKMAAAISSYGYDTVSNATAKISSMQEAHPDRHPKTILAYLKRGR